MGEEGQQQQLVGVQQQLDGDRDGLETTENI